VVLDRDGAGTEATAGIINPDLSHPSSLGRGRGNPAQ
jgi:hypothetical protein